MKRLSIDFLYILVAAGAILVTSYGLFAALREPPPPPQPPIRYTQLDYYPDRAVYAPGETLVYTPTLIVNLAGRTNFLRTYWDDTRNQSARLCDGTSVPQDEFSRNLPRGIIGNARGGTSVSYTVPKMPPGHYRILNSATKPSQGESDYEVPFEIRQAC
jgi:hypothetical protein